MSTLSMGGVREESSVFWQVRQLAELPDMSSEN